MGWRFLAGISCLHTAVPRRGADDFVVTAHPPGLASPLVYEVARGPVVVTLPRVGLLGLPRGDLTVPVLEEPVELLDERVGEVDRILPVLHRRSGAELDPRVGDTRGGLHHPMGSLVGHFLGDVPPGEEQFHGGLFRSRARVVARGLPLSVEHEDRPSVDLVLLLDAHITPSVSGRIPTHKE